MFTGKAWEPSLEIEDQSIRGAKLIMKSKHWISGHDYQGKFSLVKDYQNGWFLIRIGGFTGWIGLGATAYYPSQLLIVFTDEDAIIKDAFGVECGKMYRQAIPLLEAKIKEQMMIRS